ncbi:hypothetical protein TNCV_934731 [Trichonephila clavipes]|nr:hypothetical protein TNCV_934731 [Trichonephila clavipes]
MIFQNHQVGKIPCLVQFSVKTVLWPRAHGRAVRSFSLMPLKNRLVDKLMHVESPETQHPPVRVMGDSERGATQVSLASDRGSK